MIRLFSSKFLKISPFPLQTKCEIVRNIWTSASVCHSKFTAQEIADRKRKDSEMRWSKLYHDPKMKYHAIITRLKIYPTIATFFFTPVSLLMEAQQIIPQNTYFACLACGKGRLCPYERFPFFQTTDLNYSLISRFHRHGYTFNVQRVAVWYHWPDLRMQRE